MIFSFTGAQSTGKSTLLNNCKTIYNDLIFVDEVTRLVQRTYNVPINEQADDITQLLILNQHLHNYVNLKDKNVLMDRCIIDGVVYTKWLWMNGKVSKWVYDYALSLMRLLIKDLDVIFYCIPDFSLVDDGVRSTNLDFRDAIKITMDDLLYDLRGENFTLVRLTGSVEDRMKIVTNTINSKLYAATR